MGSQLKLLSYSNEHGGQTRRGKRKIARPVAIKRPMHIVLRARRSGLVQFHGKIHSILSEPSKAFQVQTYARAICSTHIHLAIRARSRGGLSNFLRVVSGKIAQVVSGARRGRALTDKFWKHTPFTRIVEWGRAFTTLLRYVVQNEHSH